MARILRNSKIDSRSARLKLPVQAEPHWMKITKGCYLGYCKNQKGGSWVARFHQEVGGQKYTNLGPADDALDADGITALSFEQAQKKAQDWFQLIANGGTRSKRSAYTVADCIGEDASEGQHRQRRSLVAHRTVPRHGKAALALPHH